ncbi:MFS transporter [Romboutsia sp.]|uniref:MFS transporter n=1 Tax=Romboutsia sp. TaxID=1965302 RepID=UPI003F399983
MDTNINNKKDSKLVIILLLYLLGIFMGAIDTGIVSPARTVIQNNLGVNEKTGIWLITIYTLTYAAIIPISGKLADKLGRKYVYIVSIFLFGGGSLICGLSSFFSSFPMLLAGRVIQAIGGGGIMPIANAEFGTTFPPEKRGMALGLVGAVYGIANILGSTIGSGILDIFGTENWKYLFFVNVPISIVIIVGGLIFIKNNKGENNAKIDKLGTLFLVCMIVSLLYGLMNIDFFNFKTSIQDSSVYPYLIAFICLLPIFIFVERKVSDPILKINYFTKPRIVIVLILSLIVGIGMMGMVFVPQFAENALKIKAGSGGYFVALLGLFAGFGAPMSGNLIDKYGPKKILLFGFTISMLGALYLFTVATRTNSWFSVCISLIIMGTGMGFTMGTPLNYMMLESTPTKEASSALSTLSLIRSIGTSISPAIMIGFLANAGANVQNDIMNIIGQPQTPQIVQVTELQNMLDELKSDPDMAKQLKNVIIPDVSNSSSNKIDMSSGSLPKDLLNKLQSSDVTTITGITKEVSTAMYNEKVPPVIAKIENNVQKGINGTQKGIDGMTTGQEKLQEGIDGIQKGIDNMSKAVAGIEKGMAGIQKGYDGISKGIVGMEQGIAKQDGAIKQMEDAYNKIPNIPSPNPGDSNGNNSTTMPPGGGNSMDKEQMKAQIDKLKTAREELNTKLQASIAQRNKLDSQLNTMKSQKSKLEAQLSKTKNQKQDMIAALAKMETQKASLVALNDKTKEVKEAIPVAFAKSQKDYITSIENKREKIEGSYQSALNVGFKQMYIAVFCVNLTAAVIVLFYKSPKKIEQES